MSAALELDVLVTAQIPMPYHYVFRAEGGGWLGRLRAGLDRQGEVIRAPCLAYVVHHPSAGHILVDTGFHPDASHDLSRDLGRAMGWLFRGLEPDRYDLQLRDLGIEPGRVTQVVMTHLHADHTSGMRLLPEAEFVCSQREWSAARSRLPAAKGYVPHHLPSQSRVRLVEFDAEAEPHGPFAQTIDLLGDGSIRLISTPGHTPGHMSVLLHGVQGREVLIVGDAAYTIRSITEEILPMLTADDAAYRRSLRELKVFSVERPEATLIPTHDPDAWRAAPTLSPA